MRSIIILCFSLATLMLASPAQADCIEPKDPDPILIATGFNWPHVGPKGTGSFAGMMKEAFCRTGRGVEIVKMPAARAILQANSGAYFGDGPRRWSLAGQYRNLLLQQPALYNLKFYAFSLEAHDDVKSYSDLLPYRIGSVIGRKSVEANLTAVLTEFMLASTGTLAFRQLKAGRVDFVVLDEYAGLHFAKEAGIKTIHGSLLEAHPFHMLVHVSHRDAMPAIEAALREMKADGTTKKITDKYLTLEGITLIEN